MSESERENANEMEGEEIEAPAGFNQSMEGEGEEPMKNVDIEVNGYENSNNEYMANGDYIEEQQENPMNVYIHRIRDLQQKQQILKYSISEHQDKVKQLFMNLHHKKKELLEVFTQEFNRSEMKLDIGLFQQFQTLRRTIENQQRKIIKLREEIDKQGLTGVNNDKEIIMLKQKGEQCENQIEYGRKFASTQYVRDFLERPNVYKVSYQDVKFEYETKIRLKEYLEIEKQQYDKKKQELSRMLQAEASACGQLEDQKNRLLQSLSK